MQRTPLGLTAAILSNCAPGRAPGAKMLAVDTDYAQRFLPVKLFPEELLRVFRLDPVEALFA